MSIFTNFIVSHYTTASDLNLKWKKKIHAKKKTEILGNERNKGDNKKKSVERLIAWKCRREVGPMKLYTTNAANSTIKNRAHLKNEFKYNNDGKMKGKNRILHESFFLPAFFFK